MPSKNATIRLENKTLAKSSSHELVSNWLSKAVQEKQERLPGFISLLVPPLPLSTSEAVCWVLLLIFKRKHHKKNRKLGISSTRWSICVCFTQEGSEVTSNFRWLVLTEDREQISMKT